MKKNFILIIALILLVVGCGKKKEENVENNIDNFEKNKKEIIDYFKENLSGIWSYSEGKIIVNDDYSVELALYNIDNWIKCGDSSELFIELLQDSDKSRLNKVSELTFVCRNNNFDVSGKTIISDIKNTSHDNFSNNSKIYDENGNIMNVSIADEYKNLCVPYAYKEIFRNPENYINKYFTATGEVIQVTEEKEGKAEYFVLRVNMTKDEYGWYSDTIMVMIPKTRFNGRVIEDDIISFYGLLQEPMTYTTVMGNDQTVPFMLAMHADLVG